MKTKSVKKIVKRSLIIIFASVILAGASYIIYSAYFEPKDDYHWDGHSLEEVLSMYQEQKSMFNEVAGIIIHNERFWDEGRQYEEDGHAWISSPNDKKKMSLFTQADQEVIREFFYQTKPYRITLDKPKVIRFYYINEDKTDGYTIAYYYGDKTTTIYNGDTYYHLWSTSKPNLTDFGDDWFLYYRKDEES